jgi:hypothetical protein
MTQVTNLSGETMFKRIGQQMPHCLVLIWHNNKNTQG